MSSLNFGEYLFCSSGGKLLLSIVKVYLITNFQFKMLKCVIFVAMQKMLDYITLTCPSFLFLFTRYGNCMEIGRLRVRVRVEEV